jgi:hypothetical protein
MLKLVRYGSLKPKKQKHYETGKDKSFHNPPVRKGLYAFNPHYIETFLLGGEKKHGKETIDRFKDHEKHNLKHFMVDGPIWVHIAHHPSLAKYVLDRKGSWQLINSSDYDKIFKKNAMLTKSYAAKAFGDPAMRLLPAYRYVAKDEMEVFVPNTTKIY